MNERDQVTALKLLQRWMSLSTIMRGERPGEGKHNPAEVIAGWRKLMDDTEKFLELPQ